MKKFIVDIKTTGYDVVKDDIVEITIIDVDTKNIINKQFGTNVKIPREIEIANGIRTMKLRGLSVSTHFTSSYIFEFFELLNGHNIFTYSSEFVQSFLIQKFASKDLLLDLETKFISVGAYYQTINPTTYNEVCKKVLKSTEPYVTDSKKRCLTVAKIMSDSLGKKLSEVSLNDIKNVNSKIFEHSHTINIESSGKIIRNVHTGRILIMFGQYYGSSINEIPRNYIDWVTENKSFSIELRTKMKKLFNISQMKS